jgi:hypothetical protein
MMLYVLWPRLGSATSRIGFRFPAMLRLRPLALTARGAIAIILVQLGVIMQLIESIESAAEPSSAPQDVALAPPARDSAAVWLKRFQADMYRQAITEAKAGVPDRLAATYFRGNDERDPRLFNGGDYCTATIQISLCTEDGKAITHGAKVTGKLFLRVQINRAPFTADQFFTPAIMKHVGLKGNWLNQVGATGGSTEYIRFSTVVPHQKWEAVYPIAQPTTSRPESLEGIVYLCMNLNLPHYGIQYRLDFEKDVISSNSHLWMAPVFFTIASLNNWFSHTPIPELPHKNTDDPYLLGLHKLKAATEEKGNGP